MSDFRQPFSFLPHADPDKDANRSWKEFALAMKGTLIHKYAQVIQAFSLSILHREYKMIVLKIIKKKLLQGLSSEEWFIFERYYLSCPFKRCNTMGKVMEGHGVITTAASMIHGVEIFHLMTRLKLRKERRESKLTLLFVIMGRTYPSFGHLVKLIPRENIARHIKRKTTF